MSDAVSLLVGASLLALGYLVGRFARPRPRPAEPTATCGCGHGFDQHDPAENRCHAELSRATYNQHGEVVGYTYVPCTCQRYVGPLPAEHIIQMHLLPPQ
jgi:hypothetical protein